MPIQKVSDSRGLGEILEMILDKGIVIAGDIKVCLADIELLTIRIRLVIASVDKAVEMGIDWWKSDPYLSDKAKDTRAKTLIAENRRLKKKLAAYNLQSQSIEAKKEVEHD